MTQDVLSPRACVTNEVSESFDVNQNVSCECHALNKEVTSVAPLDLNTLLLSDNPNKFEVIRKYYRLAGYISTKDPASYQLIFSGINDPFGGVDYLNSVDFSSYNEILNGMHTRFRVRSILDNTLLDNKAKKKLLDRDYTFDKIHGRDKNGNMLVSLGVKSYQCYETTKYDEESGNILNQNPHIPILQKSIFLFVSEDDYNFLSNNLKKGHQPVDTDIDVAFELATTDNLTDSFFYDHSTNDQLNGEQESLRLSEFTVEDVWNRVSDWANKNLENGYTDRDYDLTFSIVNRLLDEQGGVVSGDSIHKILSQISYDKNSSKIFIPNNLAIKEYNKLISLRDREGSYGSLNARAAFDSWLEALKKTSVSPESIEAEEMEEAEETKSVNDLHLINSLLIGSMSAESISSYSLPVQSELLFVFMTLNIAREENKKPSRAVVTKCINIFMSPALHKDIRNDSLSTLSEVFSAFRWYDEMNKAKPDFNAIFSSDTT